MNFRAAGRDIPETGDGKDMKVLDGLFLHWKIWYFEILEKNPIIPILMYWINSKFLLIILKF